MHDDEDGGPAYPIQDFNLAVRSGMSLRDWFAGQAMAAFAINPDAHGNVKDEVSCAASAYDLADAMIAEKRRREIAE